MRQEKVEGLVVRSVVDVGVERTSVDQDRYLVTSAARSSSIRSEWRTTHIR